jgi:hypothetical protein
VTIKITWDGSMLYFWMLDDIILFEGWDYDLEMKHWQSEITDERFEESAGFYYMMPKTQIMPIGGFEASVINYGEYEMSDIKFNVKINKNHIEQFNSSSEPISYMCFGETADTLVIPDSYTPVDYGHYDISLVMIANEDDQSPSNNEKSYYFHVTDSVFARTPDISEVDESPWRNLYQYTHEGDIMGVEFNPIEDCIASSISVNISRSNLDVDFKFILMEIKEGEEDVLNIVELLASETRWVDQEVLDNGWLTLLLEHDGIGEYLKAGTRYLAAVQFWTYIEEDDLKNRGDTFYVGATQSYPSSYDKQWLFESYTGLWTQGSNNNKMIRLNIDNHENIIDGKIDISNVSSLQQNFPNPFTGATQIYYTLANAESVSIEIKDISGRIVGVLNEGIKPAGMHSASFSSNGLEAGLYYYTLKAGGKHTTKKMTIQ